MKTDIIQNIIQNAGSIENLVIIKQDFETESECSKIRKINS